MGLVLISGARAGGGLPGLPDWVHYTGLWNVHLRFYGNQIYVEWEMWTSGTLTVDKETLMDLCAVGGGGNASGSNYFFSVGGGGSGYLVSQTQVSLVPGVAYEVTVGAAAGSSKITGGAASLTAAPGGNGTADTPPEDGGDIPIAYGKGGTGFNGPYHLFDDDRETFGTGSNGGNSGPSRGGNGGGGVTIAAVRGGDGVTMSPENTPGKGGIGYGAGSGGNSYPGSAPGGAKAAQGVVLARMLAGKGGRGGTFPTACDGTLESCLYLNSPDGVNAWLEKINGEGAL